MDPHGQQGAPEGGGSDAFRTGKGGSAGRTTGCAAHFRSVWARPPAGRRGRPSAGRNRTAPGYRAGRFGETPLAAASAARSGSEESVTLFRVNRALEEELKRSVSGLSDDAIGEPIVQAGSDPDAVNTVRDSFRVRPTVMKALCSRAVIWPRASRSMARLNRKKAGRRGKTSRETRREGEKQDGFNGLRRAFHAFLWRIKRSWRKHTAGATETTRGSREVIRFDTAKSGGQAAVLPEHDQTASNHRLEGGKK